MQIVVIFIALLELIKDGAVDAAQDAVQEVREKVEVLRLPAQVGTIDAELARIARANPSQTGLMAGSISVAGIGRASCRERV